MAPHAASLRVLDHPHRRATDGIPCARSAGAAADAQPAETHQQRRAAPVVRTRPAVGVATAGVGRTPATHDPDRKRPWRRLSAWTATCGTAGPLANTSC